VKRWQVTTWDGEYTHKNIVHAESCVQASRDDERLIDGAGIIADGALFDFGYGYHIVEIMEA